MKAKLWIGINDYDSLEVDLGDGENFNFILHEVDRLHSILDQHMEQKEKDEKEKKGKKPRSRRSLRVGFLLAFFGVGILYGILISRTFPEVMRFLFH